MDVVSDVLRVAGVRGTLGACVEAGGRWAVAGDDGSAAGLHAITTGEAWLTRAGHSPLRLRAGDVVLLAAGVPYVLGDAPGSPVTACDPAELARSRRTGEPVRFGISAPDTRIVTIAYDCDRTVRTQLLSALPELMHVRGGTGADGLDDTVRMLGRELAHPQFATTAVLASLVDIVLIQVLRAWLPTHAGERRGTWLGMMGDPVVHRALQHLHADPARPWTTETLATAVAASRSTLTRRFPAAVGMAPVAYLTQWRLDLAASRLRTTDQPVESIAVAVGYNSTPAFSRAFTRSHGAPPGRYRTMHRPKPTRPTPAAAKVCDRLTPTMPHTTATITEPEEHAPAASSGALGSACDQQRDEVDEREGLIGRADDEKCQRGQAQPADLS